MEQLIETTANQIFLVEDHADPALSHVWTGIEMKRNGSGYIQKKNAKPQLIRKAGSKVIAG